eukprot:SAG11_NODE_33933_length_274_cov_1.474286_1_plen_33_part_10
MYETLIFLWTRAFMAVPPDQFIYRTPIFANVPS